MSLEEEKEVLKLKAIELMNGISTFPFGSEDLHVYLRKPTEGNIFKVLIVTEKSGDNVRLQFNVLKFDNFTTYRSFELKNLPNSSSGDLSDEVFVADVILGREEFKSLYVYHNSLEFKDFLNQDLNLTSVQGHVIKTQSGLLLGLQS